MRVVVVVVVVVVVPISNLGWEAFCNTVSGTMGLAGGLVFTTGTGVYLFESGISAIGTVFRQAMHRSTLRTVFEGSAHSAHRAKIVHRAETPDRRSM